ncbi:MAG: pyridoxamine 5'-phosphate oxidase family protein [Spirochaetales bacterium]|nr:pyridoxamine 5'-phosphate oxidase family protein [Spirochaetales bacterium]
MRRSEKQITDNTLISEILEKNTVCRLALSQDNRPYIVPMSYGYAGNVLYFHSAGEGRKIDMLAANNSACFEISDSIETVTADAACGYGLSFRSVIGFGKIGIVHEQEEKILALNIIMKQHTGKTEWHFSEKVLQKTVVLKLEIDSLTGKISGNPGGGRTA